MISVKARRLGSGSVLTRSKHLLRVRWHPKCCSRTRVGSELDIKSQALQLTRKPSWAYQGTSTWSMRPRRGSGRDKVPRAPPTKTALWKNRKRRTGKRLKTMTPQATSATIPGTSSTSRTYKEGCLLTNRRRSCKLLMQSSMELLSLRHPQLKFKQAFGTKSRLTWKWGSLPSYETAEPLSLAATASSLPSIALSIQLSNFHTPKWEESQRTSSRTHLAWLKKCETHPPSQLLLMVGQAISAFHRSISSTITWRSRTQMNSTWSKWSSHSSMELNQGIRIIMCLTIQR